MGAYPEACLEAGVGACPEGLCRARIRAPHPARSGVVKWDLRAVMLTKLGDVDGGVWRELMVGMEKDDGWNCPKSLMVAGLDSQECHHPRWRLNVPPA